MPTAKNKALIVVLSGVLFWMGARMQNVIPFVSPVVRSSSEEKFEGGQVPASPNVRHQQVKRSDAGLLLGEKDPGFVQWAFSRQETFPHIFQPFFVALDQAPTRVVILTPSHPQPRILFKNVDLRYRAFDVSRWVHNEPEFILRFEGKSALLAGLRFYDIATRVSFPWVGFGLAVLVLGWRVRSDRRLWYLGAITAIGFILRWILFSVYQGLPLKGDALGYWDLAQSFRWTHLFSTGSREPGFVWVVSLAKNIFGESTTSLRFWGVLLSTCSVPLTARLAKAAGWHPEIGLLSALLVAVNPFSIFMSVQGYQLEFFILEILLFSIAWFKKEKLAMGLLGGLLCVTRIQSLFAVLPLVGIACWQDKWQRKDGIRFLIPFLVFVVPYFVSVRAHTGSFLGHLNPHAAYYARIEAREPQGTSSGSSTSLTKFLFDPQTLGRRGVALLKGYGQIFLNPNDEFNRILLNSHYSRHWNLLVLPFFWMGIVMALRSGKDRKMLWVVVLFLSGLPMLHDWIREPRLLFHVQPFFALLSAYGVWIVLERAKREKRLAFLSR